MEAILIAAVLPIVGVLLWGTVEVMLVGVVGGPIKAETPIVMTVLHFVAFFFWASEWPGEAIFSYIAILVSCAGVQLLVAIDLFKKPDERRLSYRLARGLLASAHVGLVLLILVRAGVI
jgi:hypothetical protein